MKTITLKRILLMFTLVVSILFLSYVKMIQAENQEAEVSRLIVNRKQKQDYNRFFERGNFKAITVEFTTESFEALLTSMQAYFDEYGTYQDNTMHKVTLHYQDGYGTSFSVNEVGFRTKSNTSRNLPLTYDWRNREQYHQTSFQLQFDATFDYDKKSNEYAILNNREVFNMDQINFEYCKSYDSLSDQAMISEAYSYQLYKAAGTIASNASYGLVYLKIADKIIPYGFFTFIEPIDQEFIKKNFDSDLVGDYGDLYKATDVVGPATLGITTLSQIGINENEINLRHMYSLKNNTLDGTRTRFTPLTNFIENLNRDDYFKEHYQEMINTDMFLRSLAMDFLIGNTDDYRYNYNNYYLYFDVYTDQVTYIPFDLDSSLGFGKHQDLTGNYGVYYDLFSETDNEAVLISKLLSIPDNKNQYYLYLADFASHLFDFDSFYQEYLQAKDQYETILIEENHLGNQVFALRNSEWYFTEKANTVLQKIAELNE